MKRYVVKRGCTKCLACYYECPAKAITVSPETGAYIDPEKCLSCGICADNCSAEAIILMEEKEYD